MTYDMDERKKEHAKAGWRKVYLCVQTRTEQIRTICNTVGTMAVSNCWTSWHGEKGLVVIADGQPIRWRDNAAGMQLFRSITVHPQTLLAATAAVFNSLPIRLLDFAPMYIQLLVCFLFLSNRSWARDADQRFFSLRKSAPVRIRILWLDYLKFLTDHLTCFSIR